MALDPYPTERMNHSHTEVASASLLMPLLACQRRLSLARALTMTKLFGHVRADSRQIQRLARGAEISIQNAVIAKSK